MGTGVKGEVVSCKKRKCVNRLLGVVRDERRAYGRDVAHHRELAVGDLEGLQVDCRCGC